MEKVIDFGKREMAEVKEILHRLDKEIYDKIPKNIINFFDSNQSTYNFIYDDTKDYNEQNISPISSAFIWDLYYYYCANEEEKKIMTKNVKRSQEFAPQTMPNAITSFDELNKERGIKTNDENINKVNQELIEKPKESFITRIIKKITNFFKKG